MIYVIIIIEISPPISCVAFMLAKASFGDDEIKKIGVASNGKCQ